MDNQESVARLFPGRAAVCFRCKTQGLMQKEGQVGRGKLHLGCWELRRHQNHLLGWLEALEGPHRQSVSAGRGAPGMGTSHVFLAASATASSGLRTTL